MPVAPYKSDLATLVSYVQAQLHLPDPAPFLAMLGTLAANRVLPGAPVWMMLVAPPSFGKTELLNMALGVPGVFEASTLTEAGLLSGTAADERAEEATGGLLREIEAWSAASQKDGILLMKDFTSSIAANKNVRDPLMAALREIHDGAWTRRLGIDGGRTLAWRGRIGFLGGVTPKIDQHHAVVASLGDRFLYYRLPESERLLVARRAISAGGVSQIVKQKLQGKVAAFINQLNASGPHLLAKDQKWLMNAAEIASRGRAAVERDSYGRDVVDVVEPESPARLGVGLSQLHRGFYLIGCSPAETRRILREVVISCIPARRARLLRLLGNNPAGLAPGSMTKGANVDYPETTILRALDDMLHLRMVSPAAPHKLNSEWRLHQDFQDKWSILHS